MAYFAFCFWTLETMKKARCGYLFFVLAASKSNEHATDYRTKYNITTKFLHAPCGGRERRRVTFRMMTTGARRTATVASPAAWRTRIVKGDFVRTAFDILALYIVYVFYACSVNMRVATDFWFAAMVLVGYCSMFKYYKTFSAIRPCSGDT